MTLQKMDLMIIGLITVLMVVLIILSPEEAKAETGGLSGNGPCETVVQSLKDSDERTEWQMAKMKGLILRDGCAILRVEAAEPTNKVCTTVILSPLAGEETRDVALADTAIISVREGCVNLKMQLLIKTDRHYIVPAQ